MSLQDDVDLLLTCAPAAPCPREEACFRVAKYLRDRLEPAGITGAPEKTEEDVVADYEPHWETRNGFIPCRES